MSALSLYNDLIEQGFKLSMNQGKLELVPASKLTDSQRIKIKQHKSELLHLLAANTHLVTCRNCAYLSSSGTCTRLSRRVLPDAMRECSLFGTLKNERTAPVEVNQYTHEELERLLNESAKPLYFHLIDCEKCNLEDARYCEDGFVLGNAFDDLLLCFDDATSRRYLLMNQFIKARRFRKRTGIIELY